MSNSTKRMHQAASNIDQISQYSAANCISNTLSPNVQANITACQNAGVSSFCWPPNGTRICVPSSTTRAVPFYFPKSYYGNDTLLSLTWNQAEYFDPSGTNTGSRNLYVYPQLYTSYALTIPNTDDERWLPIFMRAKKNGSAQGDVHVYPGPTIILVKLGDFATSSAGPKSTATSAYSNHDDKDALTGLTSGAMAGIIVAILVVIIALVTLCCCLGCCACCGVKKRAVRSKRTRHEQARVIAQGTELVEQGSAAPKTEAPRVSAPRLVDEANVGLTGSLRGQDEMPRVEAERARVQDDVIRDYLDPPPKYAP
ncbi:hypothetical protein ACEQ8H_006699 [Pleosporales sp. CAS-2024a]